MSKTMFASLVLVAVLSTASVLAENQDLTGAEAVLRLRSMLTSGRSLEQRGFTPEMTVCEVSINNRYAWDDHSGTEAISMRLWDKRARSFVFFSLDEKRSLIEKTKNQGKLLEIKLTTPSGKHQKVKIEVLSAERTQIEISNGKGVLGIGVRKSTCTLISS